jgi:hypothetical protein
MGIRSLTFLGERDRPDPLSAVHARRPILGSGKPPNDLVELARTRRYYVRAKEKPSTSIEALGKGDKRVWEVSLPAGDELRGARDNVIAGGSGFTSLAAWGRSN